MSNQLAPAPGVPKPVQVEEEEEEATVAAATGAATAEMSPVNTLQHPPSFYCPISQQCMHDPVVLSDGHSYERRHIERWLEDHGTSPVSGLRLPQLTAFPNHALRNAIEEYFQQVFSAHRQAIRRTMGSLEDVQIADPRASLVHTIDALMQCSLLMNADLSTECVLRRIMEEARALLGAEVASVFLLDAARQELYSTVNSTGGELRIPVAFGIAGHVARTGEPLIVPDAYSDSRFDRTIDAKTGFRTRSVLCVPLKAKRGGVLGVTQLINKVALGEEPADAGRFTADDQHFLRVFACQAATAVANSGAFDLPRGHAADRAKAQRSGAPHGSPHSGPAAGVRGGSPAGGRAAGDADKGGSAEAPGAETEKVADSFVPLAAPPDLCDQREARVAGLLERALGGWQFDALALAEATGNRPLSVLGEHLFSRLGLVEDFGLSRERVSRFFAAVEAGYDGGAHAAYHCRAHAASVLHALHALLQHGGVLGAAAPALAGGAGSSAGAARGDSAGSGQLERMACLMAAAVHDYEHKGLSNDFLVMTGDERALRYNDQHVNEHHHVAAAFSVLLRSENNFLSHLPTSDFRRLRNLIIDLVLGTDMADGARIIAEFSEVLDTSFREAGEPGSDSPAASTRSTVCPAHFVPATSKEAVLLLQVAMKCADLGHLALPWDSHVLWVQRLEEEFFAQGDREKQLGLPVSFPMDRCKPGASATQVGFLERAALPLFRALARAAPGARPALAGVLENLQRWRALAVAPAVEGPGAGEAKAAEAAAPESESEAAGARAGKRRSGRARQRAAKWRAAVRCRTPSPDGPWV